MRFHTLAQRPPRAVETNRGGVGRNPEVTGKRADRDTVEDDPSQKRSLIGADLIELRYHARARHRYQHRHQHRGARLVQRRLFAAAAAADPPTTADRTIRDSHAAPAPAPGAGRSAQSRVRSRTDDVLRVVADPAACVIDERGAPADGGGASGCWAPQRSGEWEGCIDWNDAGRPLTLP
jgi:hypothetical protein